MARPTRRLLCAVGLVSLLLSLGCAAPSPELPSSTEELSLPDPVHGFRSAPSAGATYPLDVLVSVGRVDDLAPGLYRYQPEDHKLILWQDEDVREELAQAALGLATVMVGAFVDEALQELLGIEEAPLAILSVGAPAG